MDDYLASLNKEQKSAVTNIEGPTLILAGAGTGKTRTITMRMAYIIENHFSSPHEILAVTFTNKAAREMLNRINNLTNADGIWLGTFHSIATKILRQYSEKVGLKEDFTIINSDDQLQLIKNIVNDLYSDYSTDGYKIILNIIQRWKDRGLLPEDVTSSELNKQINNVAHNVYGIYQDRLKSLNSADFGDLLLYNTKIFMDDGEVLSQYQNKFKYIMVDEYQDTNIIQYSWLKLLSEKRKNLCCVGDDDQSIYSWRGAEVGNILRFSDDFPTAQIIRLECNYRSTINILETASGIINHNKSRLGKKLWTTNTEGHKVNLMKFWDGRSEARYISEYIRNMHEHQFSDIAILVRAGFQTRIFEEYLIHYNIPYKIIGSTRFYDRQEIRDIIAYLKIINNPNDDIALERIINKPKRTIGTTTLKKIFLLAKDNYIPLLKAAQILIDTNQLANKTQCSLQDLLQKIENWRVLFNKESLSSTIKTITYESGYMEMLEQEGQAGLSRIENIKELLSAVTNFNDIVEFLEHISLVTELDSLNNNDNCVCVMTLHAAKGLEFPVVFLPGWEEGLFPHEKSLYDKSGKSLEEERRLAYVGITRAQKKLFISCASIRELNNWRQPMKTSRFIKELPPEHVQVIKNFSNQY